jgi:hypothetical protein
MNVHIIFMTGIANSKKYHNYVPHILWVFILKPYPNEIDLYTNRFAILEHLLPNRRHGSLFR